MKQCTRTVNTPLDTVSTPEMFDTFLEGFFAVPHPSRGDPSNIARDDRTYDSIIDETQKRGSTREKVNGPQNILVENE